MRIIHNLPRKFHIFNPFLFNLYGLFLITIKLFFLNAYFYNRPTRQALPFFILISERYHQINKPFNLIVNIPNSSTYMITFGVGDAGKNIKGTYATFSYYGSKLFYRFYTIKFN